MRGLSISTAVSAALVLLSPIVSAEPGSPHASMARRHMYAHHNRHGLAKRGQCQFPTDAGLVAVTPGDQNAGWAMSPDQPCKPGMYCPYACPPGQLMAQWDPKATTYSYPASMNGGLYCNKNGEIEKPFPKKPYCYDGTGTFSCKNKSGGSVAICQTVLPGNEAMLIPTLVVGSAVLAVPDTSYWAQTAAHYYINPPGVSAEEACVWGTKEKPIGNWSPYVAGANELSSGETFVKIGWNPIYIEPDVPFRNVVPNWGVKIECEGGKCGGLPCYIDPAEHGVNEVSQMHGPGAGGANFCVVSVPKGAKATLVVFSKSGGSGGSSDTASKKPATSSSVSPTSSSASSTASPSSTSTSGSNASKSNSANKSSSVASSSTSASSEPSSTTESSSSAETDSSSSDEASSSSTEADESTSTSSTTSDEEEDSGTEDSSTEDPSDNATELFAADETNTEPDSESVPDSVNQAIGAVGNKNGAVINASPNSNDPLPNSAPLSLSMAGAMFLCSAFTSLVMVL